MKKIMIMAGGTGGHVFPGLAVAEKLRQQGHEVCWLGTEKGIEARLVPQANIAIDYIDAVGVRGKSFMHLLTAPFKIVSALMQALKIIKQQQPQVVLGMGGFASGPGALAAKLLGIPLVIHEQNAIAGTTNRIAAKLAKRVLQAFDNTFTPSAMVITVGNPVREHLPHYQLAEKSDLHVLVVGGSLGAQAINALLPEVLSAQPHWQIWHQTGVAQLETVKAAYGEKPAKVEAFIEDMASAYAWADIIVCRAGAMTVSEVAAVGVPAIFIPYPHAIDDHQTANAQYLVKQNAAFLLPQENMTKDSVEKLLQQLQITDVRRTLSENALRLAIRNAAQEVSQQCLEVAL